MGTVVEITGKLGARKTFTLETASAILPIIYKLTSEAQSEVKELVKQLDSLSQIEDKNSVAEKPSNFIKATQIIEERIARLVETWNIKIEKLGGEPKGLWLVDFDNGEGFYCWKFPETSIHSKHGYKDGFSGRQPIVGH